MSTSPARLLRSPLAIRRANGSTLLLLPEWYLACQSGLRRCRHTNTTSAASDMLLCACTSALDHPPALDLLCCFSGRPPRQNHLRALFDAQQLRRLHKRAADDADGGTHTQLIGSLYEAERADTRPSPARPWWTHSPSLRAQIWAQ